MAANLRRFRHCGLGCAAAGKMHKELRRTHWLIAEDWLTASEARQGQQDAHNAETFAHWGRVALAVARKRRIWLGTGTRMAMDGNSSVTGEKHDERDPSSPRASCGS